MEKRLITQETLDYLAVTGGNQIHEMFPLGAVLTGQPTDDGRVIIYSEGRSTIIPLEIWERMPVEGRVS